MGQNHSTCLNTCWWLIYLNTTVWKSKATQIAERHTHTQMGSTYHVCATSRWAHAARAMQPAND
jgi:hypothetical protein